LHIATSKSISISTCYRFIFIKDPSDGDSSAKHGRDSALLIRLVT
jgi:hypothetical protein